MSDERFVRMMVDELNAKAIPGIPTMTEAGSDGGLTVGGCMQGLPLLTPSDIHALWLQSRQTELALLDVGDWPLDEDGYQAVVI